MSSKSPLKAIVLVLLVFTTFLQVNAQRKDSASIKGDTVSAKTTTDTTKLKHKAVHPYPNPAKAMLYSAIIPGLGQIYNKRYWKLPIIYVGLGVCTYFIISNHQQYMTFYNALNTRNNGGIDPYYNIYSSSDLVTIQQYYNRYFWLSIIGAGFIYILNVVDANVDAQLHNFDVSDNLSLNISPQLYSNPLNGKYSVQPGLCLVKRF